MNQKVFECLDCHEMLPEREKHTCQKKRYGHFFSNLEVMNTHTGCLNSEIFENSRHATSEGRNYNWLYIENEKKGISVLSETDATEKNYELKFECKPTSERSSPCNLNLGVTSELSSGDSSDGSSTVDLEVQKDKFHEKSTLQADKNFQVSSRVVSLVKHMRSCKTIDNYQPASMHGPKHCNAGPSAIDAGSCWCPQNRHFVCPTCGRGVGRRDNFVVHLRIHSGDKNFSCDRCKRSFNTKKSRNRHLLTHSEKRERPFSCDICGKNFFRIDHLNRHSWTHTREKPFSCVICKKTFIEKCNFRRHLDIHSKKNFIIQFA